MSKTIPLNSEHSDFSSASDKELLQAIALSNNSAYRVLFNKYYKVLLGTAINIIKDIDSGKDAVQEVFLQLWKNRERMDISSSLDSYLKRAVINRSLSIIKTAKRFEDDTALSHHVESSAGASEILEGKDMEQIIAKAMEKIPERCRIAFVLKRQEGLSLKEIAEKLDISPKTVENQITKALKILKEAIQPHLDNFNNST